MALSESVERRLAAMAAAVPADKQEILRTAFEATGADWSKVTETLTDAAPEASVRRHTFVHKVGDSHYSPAVRATMLGDLTIHTVSPPSEKSLDGTTIDGIVSGPSFPSLAAAASSHLCRSHDNPGSPSLKMFVKRLSARVVSWPGARVPGIGPRSAEEKGGMDDKGHGRCSKSNHLRMAVTFSGQSSAMLVVIPSGIVGIVRETRRGGARTAMRSAG
jgi:hypothetical protein